jgi:hypothetical protein
MGIPLQILDMELENLRPTRLTPPPKRWFVMHTLTLRVDAATKEDAIHQSREALFIGGRYDTWDIEAVELGDADVE